MTTSNNPKVIWNPAEGLACQGDVVLMRLPNGVSIPKNAKEIPAKGMRLILAEGEVTGHHHAIEVGLMKSMFPQATGYHAEVLDRPAAAVKDQIDEALEVPKDTLLNDLVGKRAAKAKKKAEVGIAKMYESRETVDALVRNNVLTTNRLAIGFLEVTGAPVDLTHDEHATIQIPPGQYYIGAQREYDAAEERRVMD